MRKHLSSLLVAGAFALLAASDDTLLGQRGQQPAAAAKPAPRLPDGRVNLGTAPGEKGYWSRTRRQLVIDSSVTNPLPTDLKVSDVPFQPWAKGLWEYRRRSDDRDSPHARCKPSAGPRQIGTAYGFEMVEFPEQKKLVIFDLGGPQSFRTVYMDGRPHPTNLEPSYYGHSVGRWEGDTLVVDSIGFNEGNWIDTEGLMHTDKYHQIEKFTRVDFNTLKYEVTIDDPGAYTKPWTAGFLLRWNPGAELFEYICQDNNMNQEMVLDDLGDSMNRANAFTP